MEIPARTQTVVEDYVKVIYSHTEWQPDAITPSALAARLGLAPSSVTEMVKKLAASGLVDHERYGAIRLSTEGEALALRMLRRHRLIETWLVRQFAYGWDEVHDEAEVLEHALTDRLLDAIDEQLGGPTRDPHGDPIPAVDGTVSRPDAIALLGAPTGHEGRVVRISDRDPGLLRALAVAGIELDASVRVAEATSERARVVLNGQDVALPPGAAAAIWLSA
jgi:DtxR family Mn-dependent transcriptional regulator